MIGSSSFLQLIRGATIKACMRLNFGGIPPLDALEHLKMTYDIVSTLMPPFLIGSSSFFLAGKEDNHKISGEFEFQPDSTKDCGRLAALEHLKKIL